MKMKDYTELVFILDRSGSMGGLERDTIGGSIPVYARIRGRRAMPLSRRSF